MKRSPPLGHTWVETADGTPTLFSEQFQEACHSPTGAREETLLHYVHGCDILSRASSKLTILEVGFGTGLGFLTTLDEMNKAKAEPWHFVSLEIDRNLLEWFRLQNLEHEFLKNLRWVDSRLECKSENVRLTILSGNARSALPAYVAENKILFDAIYQDAFSPKRNPVLWTTEWFSLLRSHAHPEAIMSTYSSSDSTRKSMVEAGWILSEGDKFGPKRSSTRARLIGEQSPIIMDRLNRSPAKAITDSVCSHLF